MVLPTDGRGAGRSIELLAAALAAEVAHGRGGSGWVLEVAVPEQPGPARVTRFHGVSWRRPRRLRRGPVEPS
ncbi:MAG TPA: hypothetical protein VE088_05690 [Gaiellaceae bacterium]|nr:hypothetical protein [Gaiellaceae bacterium]